MKIRLGVVQTTSIKIIVASLTDATISATCSGGSVAVTQLTNRLTVLAQYLGAGLVTITGLTPGVAYTYTVTQGATTISGGFRTLPATQATDFSFTLSTCDYWGMRSRINPWALMRSQYASLEAEGFPLLFQLHIDDVAYVDTMQISDGAYISTGVPQDTKVTDDYALAWGQYLGLFNTYSKYTQADRQWCYQNIPMIGSGGDHMIENNHCRGQTDDPGYEGCDRTLEATALAEWDAFVGASVPPVLRADTLYWGYEAGPIRFALLEMTKTTVPYDGIDTTQDRYGATQLADIKTYLNVDTVPFKCYLQDSGNDWAGQPWYQWHTTECQAWKDDFDATDNVNGVAGNSWQMYGDYHSPHVISHDTFWDFCAGVLQDSTIVGAGFNAKVFNWAGQHRWGLRSKAVNGDRLIGGYWLGKVHASATPQTIELGFWMPNRGRVYGPVFLEAGSANNQWTYTPAGVSYTANSFGIA